MYHLNYGVNDNPSARTNSSESLMNAGFMAKELRQYDEALHAFVRALAAQPSDSTTPYLVIEIGSILKSKGNYDEAIMLFSNAQKLPAVIRNTSLQHELTNMIAYLRITKNVLLDKRLKLLPFSQIPTEIVKEIDEEYAEWNKLEEAI